MGFLNKKKLPLFIAFIIVLLLTSCAKESEQSVTPPEVNPPVTVQPATDTVTPEPDDVVYPPENGVLEDGGQMDSDATTEDGEPGDVENTAEQNDYSEPPAETPPVETPSQNSGSAAGDKVAYITIDDGPSSNITPQILDILADEGVYATFFVLPHSGLDDLYQRIIDEGHELGNHSYSHVYKKLYNADDIELFKDDAIAARDYIFDNFGYTTVSYRFPGGAMGRKAGIIEPRKEYLDEIGYRWFDWDLSTGDADSSGSGKDPSVLTANVLNNIRGRSKIVILMHDTSDKTATVKALPDIISGLKKLGYSFDLLMNY